MARLDEIFNLQMGKTPSRNNADYWTEGQYNWISIADLGTYQKYVEATKEKITESAVQESGIKSVPANTVIMSFKLSLGKTAITKESVYTNEAIMAFIPTGKYAVLPDYFYHLFSAKDWSKETNRAVMGTTLNKATLGAVSIVVPPLDEQREIAAVLDKISDLIAKRRQQLDKLDELVKSRFIELFGDPVINPHRWDKVPLSELADIRIGPFGSLLHKEDYVLGEHPLVNPSHIVDGKISADEKLTVSAEKYSEMGAYHLLPDDVVMGRRGEMGRCAVVEQEGLLCGTGSLLIRSRGDVRPDYLQKIISFPSFKKTIEGMAVGQTMPNLNVPIVSAFQIIKPPVEIQEAYYAFVEQTDKSKLAIQKSLKQLETLKKALMQEYFS
ncbi:restriction endonuclease subunit S [Massiliimalia massiliensis]|uniref:restriction endonuclease subunit S n=1 Tax=Massiliimalia massiliensis TaxID=1852384 RepID=UPI0009858757|nr:restriction endonuclease subunit S [Massiliimalia massiliensis]